MKFSSKFVCQQCGYQSPSFLGKCPECGEWNSLVEEVERSGKLGKSGKSGAKPISLAEIAVDRTERISTGISELDCVLGGGLVPGMAILLAGEPGIGKSTLLLQLAEKVKNKVLYVAGEESAGQIKIRAQRLAVDGKQLEILEETDVDGVIGNIGNMGKIGLVIVDSIQTLTTGDLVGTAGSVGQVRECAARLIAATKRMGVPLFLVGHVTKEGAIAGPKVLEHIVDTVLVIEGERNGRLRLIRTEKNRFGATDEVAGFEMTDRGLVAADLNSLANLKEGQPGSCLTITMEGTRPVVAEVQALVTSTPLPNPRRVATGVEYNRLLTIVAILQKRLSLPLYKEDIYVSVAGGLTITEPAGDLAIAMAILSSFKNRAMPARTVVFGELDLLGNIRKANLMEKRSKQAVLSGIVPGLCHSQYRNKFVIEIRTTVTRPNNFRTLPSSMPVLFDIASEPCHIPYHNKFVIETRTTVTRPNNSHILHCNKAGYYN